MLPGRGNQVRWMSGWKWMYFITAVLFTAIYGVLGLSTRASVGLITAAMIPGCFIIFLLWILFRYEVTLSLLLEMFWSGAMISTVIAVALEIVGRAGSHDVWECEANEAVHASHSIRCSSLFIIALTCVVGFSEEFAKIVPLSRIKVAEMQVPYGGWCWWRLVTSPIAFVSSGAAAGTGFAFAENLAYVLRSGNEAQGFFVAALSCGMPSE
eukprot:GHVN01006069.1.p1 GENE.GHVN01006069.1~~GHVN01006069.1.p1  ORF type:complete len:211 (+),score=29.14 GHVN01006069.1:204-836(+)